MVAKEVRELRFVRYSDGEGEIRYVVKGGSKEVILSLTPRMVNSLRDELR